ncbi:hypothetical protein BJ138DRAFT_976983, partial [Hygrophoropsis aurantiaca]
QIAEEEIQLELEESLDLEAKLDFLLNDSMEDFPDDDPSSVAQYAAQIARSYITDSTREKHFRIIKAYIAFHLKRDPNWDAKAVTRQTPNDICAFITRKCGAKDVGFEGRKFSTAVSTRAAITQWYWMVQPNESVSEWQVDETAGVCHGLPTRARRVSEFMIGLEKMKAKAGEISQSAHALSLEDMHNLYDHCMGLNPSMAERRKGIIRYACLKFAIYLFAWLMLLRIDEALNLRLESIDTIPSERSFFDVSLRTRKSAQTGAPHIWRMHANDKDPKICPKRALTLLAKLYGEDIPLSGPLFVHIS